MSDAFLPDRSLIRIQGTDAQSFLQALITTDLASLPDNEAWPGALLTPQGKILFDFVIWRDGADLLLETDVSQRDGLIRRLTMYKLRAPIEISAEPDSGVSVFWRTDQIVDGILDDRFARAGVTLVRQPGRHSDGDAGAYQALRIANGIAVAGEDYPLQDAFPHDVLMDFNGGLSFRKGCYVGQEVVSRMQHRGTARRRLATVHADGALPPAGTELTAGGKPLGTLGSVHGQQALAIVRIDRAGDAMATGTAILAGDVPVTLVLPAWSGLDFPLVVEEPQA